MANKLIENVSINVVSGSFIKPDTAVNGCFAWGTFDGAVITVQFSPDGFQWFDDPTGEVTFITKTMRTVTIPVGVHVRAKISNAGPSTNLTLWVM